ncbi:MAG: DUF1289 domain-containing protein [Thauera sp.]|jgi:uncharacterized protein|nr:DUF1289 domain-containing protein [Thauera sp.]
MSIASPCINICQMSPDTGWCIGCQRSLDEIARWGTASDAEKLVILAAVEERLEFLAEAGMAGGEAS